MPVVWDGRRAVSTRNWYDDSMVRAQCFAAECSVAGSQANMTMILDGWSV